MISTYILDDEFNCTEVLGMLLRRYCPQLRIGAVFNDPEEALARIRQEPPQLLFLDIEMPRLNAFDLLQQCHPIDFKVIFTTGYDQYAVRAIKFNALDYLLKPIDKDELILAVRKAQESAAPVAAQLQSVQHHRAQASPGRLAISAGNELILVEVADIILLESDGSYVSIYLQGQANPLLVTRSLREFEEIIANPDFFRVHNSYLIHLKYLRKILRNDSEAVMSDERIIPIARSRKNALLEKLRRL